MSGPDRLALPPIKYEGVIEPGLNALPPNRAPPGHPYDRRRRETYLGARECAGVPRWHGLKWGAMVLKGIFEDDPFPLRRGLDKEVGPQPSLTLLSNLYKALTTVLNSTLSFPPSSSPSPSPSPSLSPLPLPSPQVTRLSDVNVRVMGGQHGCPFALGNSGLFTKRQMGYVVDNGKI